MLSSASVVEQIRLVAARVAASYGLEIFRVQYRREGSGMVLRVQIDRPGSGATEAESVGVEECARVSRDLSAILDVDDVVPTAYTLEVSSPGLDRPLLQLSDYERFAGRRAKVVMREAVDGQMFFKGRLDGVVPASASTGRDSTGRDETVRDETVRDGGGAVDRAVVVVTDDGRRHHVPMGVITRANLEVEF
jgi:ribosome maturation factor RimP